MTPDTDDFDSAETDWLANSQTAFGFGFTKRQALKEMARNASPPDGSVEVVLIEHVGNATVGPMSTNVETFVQGERIEIPKGRFEDLRRSAIDADADAEWALDDAQHVADLEE